MSGMAVFLITAIILIALMAALRRKRRQAGIRGWVKAQDLHGMGRRVFQDPKTGIICKPDVVERKRIIEYKSAFAGSRARPQDLLLIAAQLMATGAAESELRYANRRFTFTRESREIQGAMKFVAEIVDKMKSHLRNRTAPKATPSPGRCRACRFGAECPESAARQSVNSGGP